MDALFDFGASIDFYLPEFSVSVDLAEIAIAGLTTEDALVIRRPPGSADAPAGVVNPLDGNIPTTTKSTVIVTSILELRFTEIYVSSQRY